jgi:hypothetical protein
MREINAGDEAVSCYVSVETAQGLEDREKAMRAICEAIKKFSTQEGLPVPVSDSSEASAMLDSTLSNWAKLVAPKPLVVLFDEVDVLAGDALISFLRQLRGGFSVRGVGTFPVSVALVGMRDLKDYITAAKGGVAPNPGSPFNIKEDSAVISNFTKDDVSHLFAQRTAETGQKITDEAVSYIWEQSAGQPWIVNSLFKRATMRVLDESNYETVTLEHVMEAGRQMILARETHLDTLAYRMRDPAVRRVMETLMSGGVDLNLAESDGFRLCMDLGLVIKAHGTPRVANPIYREVLARQMTSGTEDAIPEPEFAWEKTDGTLDMDALLKEFQIFWRRHSEVWEEKTDYTEVFPHLLLQAFLQRVLNGGGRIEREYAAGRGRMDLLVEYKKMFYIIEIKLIRSHDSPSVVREEGMEQIARYRDKIDSGIPSYLVIFDRRPETKTRPWEERVSWENDGGIRVLGC